MKVIIYVQRDGTEEYIEYSKKEQQEIATQLNKHALSSLGYIEKR